MMKRFLPLVAVVLLLALAAYMVVEKKRISGETGKTVTSQTARLELDAPLRPLPSCARPPAFLRRLGISQPVLIDLSQEHYTGVAMRYGKGFRQVYNPETWRRFGHMGTYAVTEKGDIFLAPMPYISVKSDTFDAQRNIYRIDGKTGEMEIWKRFDDIKPDGTNPYGIVTLAYDCTDKILWIGAIDKSRYGEEKGRIYAIDVSTKMIKRRIEGIDALTLYVGLDADGKKRLLVGSAMRPVVTALSYDGSLRSDIVILPDATMRVRKIKIGKDGTLRLQAIPFGYTLIAAGTSGEKRVPINAVWNYDKKAYFVHANNNNEHNNGQSH
jgi:hypothetical protein